MWAVVDQADFAWASSFKWYAHAGKSAKGTRWYAARKTGVKPNMVGHLLHRELLEITDNRDVDHINRSGLDNRRQNLRACTRSQNLCNKVQERGASGFVGVGQHIGGLWYARVQKDRRIHSGGYFHDPVSAARARDALALKLHGEFVRLNFPVTA